MSTPIAVSLAPYNPEWPRLANEYAERLQILGPTLLQVYHIGSTAVPGLLAKPIIDLLPVVTDLTELDSKRGSIEALGYDWCGEFGIPGRRYCRLSNHVGVRMAHVHFFATGSPAIERHIAFRDYLRAHPLAARAYAQEKLRARDLHPEDSHAYTDEKAEWVRENEAKAPKWSRETIESCIRTYCRN
jgi:GrpB-like predicted nucleotidyltransferase (UPF0157 family)